MRIFFLPFPLFGNSVQKCDFMRMKERSDLKSYFFNVPLKVHHVCFFVVSLDNFWMNFIGPKNDLKIGILKN
jgi:hypothetical protein